MHLKQLREILRDAEIANCILPIVRAHGLTEQETMDVLVALHLPRAAGVAAITQARAHEQHEHEEYPNNLMINPGLKQIDTLETWLVDLAGNVAATEAGLGLLQRITRLAVPLFVSTEQAMEWGSRLNGAQHAILIDIQRTCSNAARDSGDLQQMVNLATQSQLIREAAEAFTPDSADASAKTGKET